MKAFISLLLFATLSLSYCHNPCKPKQIHLALSDDFTTHPSIDSPIKAIFHTEESCNSAYILLETPQGTQKIAATAVNYFHADYSKGQYETYVHIFDFPHLNYDQAYQYTCFSDTSGQNSAQGPFKFYVPNPQPTNQVTSVIMYGDLGATSEGQDTLNQLNKIKDHNFTKVATYIHMGDISYNLEDKAGKVGDDFMNSIQDFAASIPYMISPGNHETLQNFSNVNMRFKMPYFAQTQNHYYSYNLGNMHFVTINLDLVLLNPEVMPYMVNWLTQDLIEANANRAERPWIIMYTHRPLYCSKKNNDDCLNNAGKFAQIEEVINKYKVDLYISGHIHAYERMLPIYKGKVADFERVSGDKNNNYIVNSQAPVYVVQGMAGHSGDSNFKMPYKGNAFTVTVDTDYSVLAVHSMNNTHLHIENIHSKNGKVSDFFYLIKESSSEARPFLNKKPSQSVWSYIKGYF